MLEQFVEPMLDNEANPIKSPATERKPGSAYLKKTVFSRFWNNRV